MNYNNMVKKDKHITKLKEESKLKKQQVLTEIKSLSSIKDSADKFEQLIKLTKSYERYVAKLNKNGLDIKVWPITLTSDRWKAAYKKFNNTNKPKKPVKSSSNKNEIEYYNIILCWTIKYDYCFCESIIEHIQKYFNSIDLAKVDTTKTDFPDRIEFCEVYKVKCTKEKYDLIIKSAEYLLNVLSNSTYDKCNIGIFGKKY